MQHSPKESPHIILAGLCSETNLGDIALHLCCQRMLQTLLDETGLAWKIHAYDMAGRKERSSLAKRVMRRLKCLLAGEAGKHGAYAMLLEEQFERTLGTGTKAIIFAGGGLLKYKRQLLPWMLAPIIRCADRHGIPVMLSGAGVEGYSGTDERCRYLKAAINKECVKSITTRDDMVTLAKYVTLPGIRTAKVADAACSLRMVFPGAAKIGQTVVGLGICRDHLFEDYGVPVSPERLMEVFTGTYKEIRRRGMQCRLFTNGDMADDRYARQVADRIMHDTGETGVLLPRSVTVEELARQISSFHGIVATRLHSSIIAYAYDVPFVGLVWNDKQRFFGESIGRPQCFITAGELSATAICNRLETAMAQPPDLEFKAAYTATTLQELRRFMEQQVSTPTRSQKGIDTPCPEMV